MVFVMRAADASLALASAWSGSAWSTSKAAMTRVVLVDSASDGACEVVTDSVTGVVAVGVRAGEGMERSSR